MYKNQQQERKNKRKSMAFTLFVHALLLLLLIFPFIMNTPDDEDYISAIEIQLPQEPSSSSSSSSSSASSQKSAREQVSMASLSNPASSQEFEVSKTQPVITAPNPDINIPEADTYFDDPLDVNENNESDQVQEIVETETEGDGFDDWEVSDVEEYSDEPAAVTSGNGSSTSGEGNNDGDGFFDGEFKGEAETGDDPFADGFLTGPWPGDTDGTEGQGIGVGKAGDGKYWGDFAGDGLFDRKVTKRANVGRLAMQEGKLVVNLCVDKRGKVIFTECDKDNSTVENLSPELIALAEDCAAHYVFESNLNADDRQCGKLTFRFKFVDTDE